MRLGFLEYFLAGNFKFFEQHEKNIADLGHKAEQYLHTDPNTCIIKVRQFAEMLAQYIAVQVGVPNWEYYNQNDLLNQFRHRGVFNEVALSLFHGIRKAGNNAAHSNHGEYEKARHQLLMAWKLAVTFHKAITKDHKFSPEFIEPLKPKDKNQEILIVQEAAAKYQTRAEEAEQELQELRQKLKVIQGNLESQGTEQVKKAKETLKRVYQESSDIQLDEKATRKLIDEQLRDAGWEVDTENLRFSKGTRPEKNKFKAIAEWPTENGPADYALFCGLKLLAVVEAKKKRTDVKGSLEQSKRYARGLKEEGELELTGQWGEYKAPFLFATNGRAFLGQLKEKSGIWFLDARISTNLPRPLVGWYTPEGLQQLFQKEESQAIENLQNESRDYLPLRDYQLKAVENVENAIINGQREIMVAMATGTGKTRLCIGLAYRLIKAKRFRRILFLVDRTSLGEQAEDSFTELKIEENKSFSQMYDIKGMEDIDVETDTRVHFSTVQGLIKRVLYPSNNDSLPVPVDQYDCIIVDECHRGYTLDKELSDEEFDYRDEKDYISKYRRVIEYFDAVKIGLTATPALHTKEIFGDPVYSYSYREAVVDGFLVDHHTPYLIKTRLSEEGIRWGRGETVQVYDPETSSVEELSNLPDELAMDLGDFNTRVITEDFNRVVCEELAKRIEWDSEEKTVIFCARDDHADMVVRLLNEAFQKHQGEVDQEAVRKITANSDRPKELIKRFKNERYPSIAVTVDLLTTGIDVPKICNIVFMRRVKSRILYDQMIGRATRLCDEIGKDHFNIYDAVDIYSSLQGYSAMKPVTPNPSVTLEELTKQLKETKKAKTKDHIIDQIIAKINARKRRLKGEALEDFKTIMNDSDPEAVVKELKDPSKLTEKDWILRFEKLARWLDKLKEDNKKMLISEHADELRAVEQGFGNNQKPEDYIEGFRKFVKEAANQIPAMQIIAQRPRDLTRQELRELKLKLDEKGYTEPNLQSAYKHVTNKDIAASIIGFIRREAIGDPLVPFDQRLNDAVSRVKQAHSFTPVQIKWIDRIAEQIRIEKIVDKEALNKGVFRNMGGYRRASKIFDGQIDNILGEIHDNIWHSSAN